MGRVSAASTRVADSFKQTVVISARQRLRYAVKYFVYRWHWLVPARRIA
jgi:hypothetical protein